VYEYSLTILLQAAVSLEHIDQCAMYYNEDVAEKYVTPLSNMFRENCAYKDVYCIALLTCFVTRNHTMENFHFCVCVCVVTWRSLWNGHEPQMVTRHQD
jgi:hypothetical protein